MSVLGVSCDADFIIMRARAVKIQAIIAGDTALQQKSDYIIAQCEGMVRTLDSATKKNRFGAGTIIQLRASEKDGGLAGIASTPDRDLYGHKIVPGAFDDSIRKRGLKGSSGVKFLLDHDWTKPAGAITRLETNSRGQLEIDVQMALDISYARDRYAAIKAIGGYNFSVGFMVEDREFVETKDDVYMLIKKGDLFEVSSVAFPGNEGATLDLSAPPSAEDKLADMLKKLRECNAAMKG